MTTTNRYLQFQSDFDRARIAMLKRRDYLLRDHPEVVEEYRAGASLAELAQKYLPEDFEISQNVAKGSVLCVLVELLDPEEKKALGIQHKKDAHKKRRDLNGKKTKDPKRVAAGKKSYETGLCKLTSEQLAQTCINGMIKRGIYPYEGEVRFVNTSLNGEQVLYPMNERDYILFLRNQRGFTWSKIEEMVNDCFNGNGRRKRKANSIRVVYQDWMKEE